MQRLIMILFFLSAVSTTGSYAHGPEGAGHGPKAEITESQASAKATQLVAAIVKEGKLDASWSRVQPSEVRKKNFKDKNLKDRIEWVITFKNPGEKDMAKQNLYVFFSLYGNYLGNNHTGN